MTEKCPKCGKFCKTYVDEFWTKYRTVYELRSECCMKVIREGVPKDEPFYHAKPLCQKGHG